MKRFTLVTVFLAGGLLAASLPVHAQTPAAQPSQNWFSGEATLLLLGREDVSSSKFQEYREVPKGVSMPAFTIRGLQNGVDFALVSQNISRSDQRYTGWLNSGWLGIGFDYNQTPHNMGFNGRSIFAESAPGVWTLSDTLQQSLQTAVQATPAAGRTYAFYSDLLAPTFASTNTVDISGLRKRGAVDLTVGEQLPVDLTFSYLRELKSGYSGVSGGNIRGMVNPSYEVAGPLNQLVQDFGVRAAYTFKAGEVYGGFNRNLYNNRAELLFVDNPFQAFDALVAGGIGGPAGDHLVNAPDNEASTGTAGFLLKFPGRTRLGGSMSLATWTQDAAFYPYTANTAVRTPSGVAAASLAALPQSSYDGKMNTTMFNVTFSSRPVKGLGLRAQFRSYELNDKSGRWVSTGDMSAPHQNWNTVTPGPANPYGRLTANPYDTKTTRFTALASYDIGGLTVEGSVLATDMERTFREATSGSDKGYGIAAIYRSSDWLRVRAVYQDVARDAEGETFFGFTSDEAERDTKRTALEIDLTPMSGLDLMVSYGKRDIEYTNRPNRRATTAGAPEIPGTPSGLLEAKYDTYSVEVGYTPNARATVGAYYTYEKDRTTNQFSTLTGVNLNNLLNYKGRDKADTFGANASFQLVPDAWTLTIYVMRQKVDGLMDITAREAGTFYTPGRTTLIPPGQGGAADITDWDDTELTTLSTELSYLLAKAWTISAGYVYEKYTFRDAFNSTNLLMPLNVYIFLKPDNGDYTANVGYATLSYRF